MTRKIWNDDLLVPTFPRWAQFMMIVVTAPVFSFSEAYFWYETLAARDTGRMLRVIAAACAPGFALLTLAACTALISIILSASNGAYEAVGWSIVGYIMCGTITALCNSRA